MRDRTRRFTVDFGSGVRHVRILASDEKTKAWADRHGPRMSVVLWKLEQAVSPKKLANDDLTKALPSALANVETASTIAMRFEELLRRGFPEETFDVRPALQ